MHILVVVTGHSLHVSWSCELMATHASNSKFKTRGLQLPIHAELVYVKNSLHLAWIYYAQIFAKKQSFPRLEL